MLDVNSLVSIITINVNGPNAHLKDIVRLNKKGRYIYMLSTRDKFEYKNKDS